MASQNSTSMKKIKVIITGSTGMVGEGVLLECLANPEVEAVLAVNRKSNGISHPKLKEILHEDFFNLQPIENLLQDYDACFFCLGISSVGVNKDDYFKMTYTLTMNFAQTLSRLNPQMIFNYISGSGTDSSEKGFSSWARVKGKTENDLMKLPFKKAYNFRPGFIKPTEGQKFSHNFYKYINWFFPVGRSLFPNGFYTMKELALSMIHATTLGYKKQILEGKDIIALSKMQNT